MSTGNVTSWDGNIPDIGPIYPFVGSEVLMVILCIVFVIGWCVIQMRMEGKELDDEAMRLRQSDNLAKALAEEHSIERM